MCLSGPTTCNSWYFVGLAVICMSQYKAGSRDGFYNNKTCGVGAHYLKKMSLDSGKQGGACAAFGS